MCIAAAIVGAAVVGGVGTAVAGKDAAGATQSASNAAISQQQQALNQQAQLSAPYRALGQQAIPTLQNLLGIGGQGTAGIQKTLAGLPGYQFAQQQGTQGAVNQASAMGLGLSGNTLQGLSQFNQGLANQNYQQYLGDIQGAVNTGQAAAAGQAANVGQSAGNISNALINQGNTLAGIDANTVAGLTKSVGSGVDNYVLNNTLQGLNNTTNTSVQDQTAVAYSDSNLKVDVERISSNQGLPIYRFEYIFELGKTHVGYMAHEVADKYPEAVIRGSLGLMVDYSKVPGPSWDELQRMV